MTRSAFDMLAVEIDHRRPRRKATLSRAVTWLAMHTPSTIPERDLAELDTVQLVAFLFGVDAHAIGQQIHRRRTSATATRGTRHVP